MSERARDLAERFEQATREMIATVERCSDVEWRTKTAGEGWTVGVVAHHVAGATRDVAGLVGLLATGQPLPAFTAEMLHRRNAEHAEKHVGCTKAETLGLLRANGTEAAATVRGLTDAQLDRSASLLQGMPPMTAEQAIERILIGHVQEHLGSIRSAIGAR
jgi:hypothetical protein